MEEYLSYHFAIDVPTYSRQLKVFWGIKEDGTFGLKIYQDGTTDGAKYHSLLKETVLPVMGETLNTLYILMSGWCNLSYL